MHYKNFKRVIALLLAVCMILPMLPATVFAEEENEQEIWVSDPDTGIEDAAEQLGEYTAPAATEPAAESVAEPVTEAEPATEAEAFDEDASLKAAAHRAPANPSAYEGRTSAGQVYLSVDGTDFVLIGTKQQLQALDYYPTRLTGNNADALTEAQRYDVMGPVWKVELMRERTSADWQVQSAELVYPGDADLTADVVINTNGDTKDFSGYTLYGVNKGIYGPDAGADAGKKLGDNVENHSLVIGRPDYETRYVGGTLEQYDLNVTSYSYGKYSPRNNYVVFRDISLSGVAWEPLMFYGLMYGILGSALESPATLESAVRTMRASEDYLDYADTLLQPTISDVTVNTAAGNLDADKYVGVGFFASITSARPGTDSGLEHVKAEVRNLKLDTVRVTNNYTGIAIDQTVVNWLTSNLGSGVGLLLDGLLRLLTGKSGTDFANSVSDLLTARAKDPTNLATGGFVGRVYALALVENCDVANVQVQGAGSYVGGFVGYSAGETQYDFVSNTAGALLNLLTTILNIIPGLGLGDLISIVRNVLPLNTLVPVDYLNPHIEDCDLTGLTGNIGPAAQTWSFNGDTVDAECNGGFIGAKIATVMINCGVHDSAFTVNAKNYGGGFAGLARDAVIQELLTDLGVNLGVMQSILKNLMESNIDLQSVQVRCVITGSDVSVRGENYLGGFNGAMANAYCVNNEMQCAGKTLSIVGTGDCVGGFAGIATLGWAMSLGQGEAVGNTSLLSTLKNVLTSLLSSYGNELLSLLGVGQSEILGLQFDFSEAQVNGSYVGNEASVEGHDYVGGLVGKADALIMTGTTGTALSKMTYFQNGDLTVWDVFPNMPKTGSFTVTYHEKDGTTVDVTVSANDNYTITMPSRSDDTANGYVFEGWVTTHCDHSTAEPSNILRAGETYVVTHDVTFNALYSKEGAPAYELITSTPSNWETTYENYIITYKRDENMVVLTGLNANTGYESASSGGASTLSQIRAAYGANSFQTEGGLLLNVPDLYLFAADKMATQDDYYFENLNKGTTLRRLTSSLAGQKGLSAYGVHADVSTQWHPFIRDDLSVGFESDYGTGNDKYIVYDARGYFRMGTSSEISEIYIWGKSKLPTRYTTVDVGVEMPDNDLVIELDSTVVGRFAQIHVNGLRLVNGHKFVGGIAGLAGTANVSGLLNDTIGVGDFKKFEINDIILVGGTAYEDGSGNDGLKVWGRKPDSLTSDTGAGYYVGGGAGLAMGGDLLRIDISRLNMVEGKNCVGGFAGCVGPGELLGTGGLNLQLLGLSLLNANNLLSVGQGLETQVQHVTVTGIPVGYTVEATGTNAAGEVYIFCAGGFFGRSNSTNADDCHAVKVQWVKANDTDGRAGGFLGVSEVGGLASMDDAEGTQIKGLISAGNLLNAVGYLIPEYTKVDTTYVDGGYVEAAWAGGFAADFQSGTVDNLSKDPLAQNQRPEEKSNPDWYAVYNIDHVTGTLYAGGFGAKVYAGALADAGGGISILGDIEGINIDLVNLLSLVNAYVPTIRYAGVKSDRSTRFDKTTGFSGDFDATLAPSRQQGGFTVECTGFDPDDKTTGAAGGFIGYASGAQVSYCDVRQLLHTTVTPPAELDGTVGTSYFDNSQSAYAVTGTRYAGGYLGFMDIGSSASLGGGLKALSILNLNDVLSALNSVISTVEHSDVYGGPGGFAVKSDATIDSGAASETEAAGLVGRSGGFVGWMRGSHIQDSHSWNFSYIIGRIAAGGYVGEMEPGSVADALGDTSVLNGLIEASGSLLTVAQDFVPTIRNSVTTCIPCGGAVRADAASDAGTQRGMAGGYAGHNLGGHIWGNNSDPWKSENETINNVETYRGPKSECAAIRILSVYGVEYAGGFTGLMDAGSTAGTGNISLLFGLVKLDNLLGALKVSYPTEENTAVYGPLAQMDYQSWNSWVDYVGQYGGYGLGMEHVASQAALDAILDDYLYGYHVTAGRSAYQNIAGLYDSGCAGGYVGSMRSGTITNGQAYNCKQVKAMRNAGGFAGEMKTGSVANLGQAQALGLDLDLGQLLTGAVDVFVPVVKTSSIHGYQNGMTVLSTGEQANGCGNAGGFAGTARGAQIWGDDTGSDNPNDGCNVWNLKKVMGSRYVGGFVGFLGSGTAAEAGTNVSEGPLQELLDAVVKSGGDNVSSLLSLAAATVSTVRKANITVSDPAWGFTVEGWTDDSDPQNPVRHVPLCAGGFVGTMEGAIIGNNDEQTLTTTNIRVNHLRGVEAQYYAGGFFGVANVGSTASVAQNKTNLLSLANLGQISALDIFRPYIYNSDVSGVSEGFTVRTAGEETTGTMNSTRWSGCAGGFGGALLDGHVQNAHVTNLSSVEGLNYTGGFIGHCGKSGVADVDNASLLQQANLLNAQAGVGDVVGSRVVSSSVSGIDLGYTVTAAGGSEPIAGGFVGFSDLTKIGFKPAVPAVSEEQELPCAANNLKYVVSDRIAGGFIGKTTKGYLVEAQASSSLVALLLNIVNVLVRALYLPQAQQADLIDANLGNIAGLELLNEGNLLGVTLFGIHITVSLGTKEDEGGATDVAKITIGDSYIELPCNENGLVDSEHSNLTIALLPLFYTTVKNSTVTGISKGYDVFGGGATQTEDGTERNGFAGGFVGFNQLGEIASCATVNCDVVRGTPAKLSEGATVSVQKVGPFTGSYYNNSTYDANGQTAKETGDTFNGTAHTQETPGADPFVSDAKVLLKDDEPLLPNPESLTAPTAEMQNPCENTVDLTLHKVWDDLAQLQKTRQSVTFTIHQVDSVTNEDTVYGTVTLTEADANAFAPAVWTRKVEGLPATETVSGVLHRYSYYVTEATANGYVQDTAYADTDAASKRTFDINAETGYVAKLTNQAIIDQTVVIDYGLPAAIRVPQYIESKYEFGTRSLALQGVLSSAQLASAAVYTRAGDVQAANAEGEGAKLASALEGSFGNLRLGVESDLNKLIYVPKDLQMTAPETVAVRLLPAGADRYYYSRVTFVPASIMYYENSFISFGHEKDAAFVHDWTDVGAATDARQGEDRPGLDELDDDNLYGYDPAYSTCTTYSLDGSKKVTVSVEDKDNWPTAQFTFTGTGFDLIGVSSNDSGFMTVQVYQGSTASGTAYKSWAVDTYFGYSRSLDRENPYVRYFCFWDGEAWHVTKTVTASQTAAGGTEDGYPVLADFPTSTTQGPSCIVYRPNYVWTTTSNGQTLYQVPVISSGDSLPYGTYTVKVTVRYARLMDHPGDGSYDLYIDGLRIYKPADPLEELDATYYALDHEGWPQFVELRRFLLGQESLGQYEDNADIQDGAVFIDGMGEVTTIADYSQIGPNNEIYLLPGQAVAFALNADDASTIDRIHASMKLVSGSDGGVVLSNGGDPVNLRFTSATERFYDVSSVVEWEDGQTQSKVVLIANPTKDDQGNDNHNIVSLRNLKITYLSEPTSTQTVRTTISRSGARRAMRYLGNAELQPGVLDDGLTFSGMSITLMSDLAINYYVPMTLLEDASNAYIVFQKDDALIREYDYTQREVNGENYAVFTFRDIPAKEMGSVVRARLVLTIGGVEHLGNELPYSVKQYAMDQLAATDDDALRTVLVDMLNYGAQAQTYFGYKTDDLVNKNLTAEQQSWGSTKTPALETHEQTQTAEHAQIVLAGRSISLNERVTINYYWDLQAYGGSVEDLAMELRWLDRDGTLQTLRIDGTQFTAHEHYWRAAFSELSASQMRTVVQCQMIRKADGAVVSDVNSYSIISYVYSVMKNEADPALTDVVLAMLRYGDAASAYFNGNQE
ncbi:MAG: hypothetical protein IJG45_03990 [Oscillospiraceae bacterium]|nr:hypothetical protein [Oscillospiraceae bacterium]